MASSRKSSRSSRAFAVKTAAELVCEELRFDQYEDLFEDVGQNVIQDYIIDEAKAVEAQYQNDVSKDKINTFQTPRTDAFVNNRTYLISNQIVACSLKNSKEKRQTWHLQLRSSTTRLIRSTKEPKL